MNKVMNEEQPVPKSFRCGSIRGAFYVGVSVLFFGGSTSMGGYGTMRLASRIGGKI